MVPFATLASEEGSVVASSIWGTVGDGVKNFTSDVLAPVTNIVSTNPIALAFLSVTFVGLGVRILRKVIGAFGRGR